MEQKNLNQTDRIGSEKITLKVIEAVIAAGLLSFSGVVVETAMNITFPTLMKTFNVTTDTVQWMTTIYLLVVAIVIPMSSFLKKRFMTKSLFIVANLVFVIGVVICAIAANFSLLLVGRIVQGFGTGIAIPLMFNVILDQVPSRKIGTMIGIASLITAIAPAIGPTFGGAMVSTIGWRFIFIFLLPILIISLVLGIISIEQKRDVEKLPFDVLSLLFIVVAFTGFILGFSKMGAVSILSIGVLGAWIVGIFGLVGLIIRSNKVTNPIIHFEVFKNKLFSGHVVVFFLLQLITLGLGLLLPNYMQLVNGSSAATAGLIVLPGALIGAVFSPFSGRILDRVGAVKPIMTGAILAVTATFLFAVNGKRLSNFFVSSFNVIYMISLGLMFGNVMTNGLKQLDEKIKADGNAVLTTLQQFAGAVGTAIVAALLAISQSNSAVSEKVSTAQGSANAFWLLFVLTIIILMVLVRVVIVPSKTK